MSTHNAATRVDIRSSHQIFVLTLFLILALCNTQYSLPLMDDVYITLQHARNLATGDGLVYNPGERVLGTTSPLYAVLLAAMYPLTSDVISLTVWIWIFSLGVSSFLIYDICGRGILGVLAGICVSSEGYLARSVIGMETAFFVCMSFLGVYLYRRGRTHTAFFVTGLLCLVRPDGVFLFAALFMTHSLIHCGSSMSRLVRRVRASSCDSSDHDSRRVFATLAWAILFCALPLLAWSLFAAAYYGSVVPLSFVAKYYHGKTTYWWPDSASFYAVLITSLKSFRYIAPLAVVAMGVVGRVVRRKDFLAGGMVMWLVLYFGAYAYCHVPAYTNYFFPFYAMLHLAAFHLMRGYVDQLFDYLRRRSPEHRLWVEGCRHLWVSRAAPIVLLIAAILASYDAEAFHQLARPVNHNHSYVDIGKYLRTETPTDAHVAAMEIGLIGYFSERPIVDFCGLVTPGLAKKIASGDTRFALDHYKPDYVVARYPVPATLEGGITRPELAANYELMFSSGGVGVFRPVREYATDIGDDWIASLADAVLIPRHVMPHGEITRLRAALQDRNVLVDEYPTASRAGEYGYYYLVVSVGKFDALERAIDYHLTDVEGMARPLSLEFDDDGDLFDPWHQVDVRGVVDSSMQLETTGGDPYVLREVRDLAPWFLTTIEIRMRVTAQDASPEEDRGALYWISKRDRKWGENNKHVWFDVVPDGDYHIYKVDVSEHFGWKGCGVIDTLRFDPIKRPASVSVDYIRIH